MENKHYIFTRKIGEETACGDYFLYNCISHESYNWREMGEIDLRVGILSHNLDLSEEGYNNLFDSTWEEIESLLLDNEITYEIVNYD